MPYQVPANFLFQGNLSHTANHGGSPPVYSYDDINLLFTNAQALFDEHMLPWNMASDGLAVLATTPDGQIDPEDYNAIHMQHTRQWLYYKSESEERTGEIKPYNQDLADENDKVTLPLAEDGAWYDLDANIEWMVPGRVYILEHVQFAFEVDL